MIPALSKGTMVLGIPVCVEDDDNNILKSEEENVEIHTVILRNKLSFVLFILILVM